MFSHNGSSKFWLLEKNRFLLSFIISPSLLELVLANSKFSSLPVHFLLYPSATSPTRSRCKWREADVLTVPPGFLANTSVNPVTARLFYNVESVTRFLYTVLTVNNQMWRCSIIDITFSPRLGKGWLVVTSNWVGKSSLKLKYGT